MLTKRQTDSASRKGAGDEGEKKGIEEKERLGGRVAVDGADDGHMQVDLAAGLRSAVFKDGQCAALGGQAGRQAGRAETAGAQAGGRARRRAGGGCGRGRGAGGGQNGQGKHQS